MVAAVPNANEFNNGRHMLAWENVLNDTEIHQIIRYIDKAFYPFSMK
jgi:hypothetical protein